VCNQGVKCIDLCAVQREILHCVNKRASGVPNCALSAVILDLGVFDLKEGEGVASGNTTKKRSRSSDKKTPAEVVLADCLEPFVAK